jgi:hypothetical protein
MALMAVAGGVARAAPAWGAVVPTTLPAVSSPPVTLPPVTVPRVTVPSLPAATLPGAPPATSPPPGPPSSAATPGRTGPTSPTAPGSQRAPSTPGPSSRPAPDLAPAAAASRTTIPMARAVGETTTSFLPPIVAAVVIGLFLFLHDHRPEHDRRLVRALIDDHDEVVRFR